jgi:hypothetical protein
MSIATPAERLEPVLTWIEEQKDAAVADCSASAASRVSPPHGAFSARYAIPAPELEGGSPAGTRPGPRDPFEHIQTR